MTEDQVDAPDEVLGRVIERAVRAHLNAMHGADSVLSRMIPPYELADERKKRILRNQLHDVCALALAEARVEARTETTALRDALRSCSHSCSRHGGCADFIGLGLR